ncbi:adhesion G-protein coupled receptor V1 isoform X1 [Tachysurus ichikawai]
MADNVPEINETVLLILDRTNTENQILKPGFTSREIVILENDDPGGVFEFSPVSRGPWFINEGETVELRVIRQKGLLLNQLVRYTVTPSGNEDFYGATGILEFQPGEREVVVALVAIPDGLPELDELFALVLSSHGTPASHLGNNKQINITVRKSDDPFGVIQFIQPQLLFFINESKGMDIHSASYPIVRGRGRFGNVSVLWVLEPTFSGDVTPVQGAVVFTEGEYLKNLTLFSKPDEVPEDVEIFTITLINATGGARLGNILNASLQINKNDDPIYFAEPVIQRVREGNVAYFTILRAGLANFVATVMYRFEFGDSSPGDFIPLNNDTLLLFDYGEWMKNISVAVQDDDIPETDERFYIVLFNTTGDAVVYGKDTATVVIEANDDANGIFSLDATEKPVEEGKSNNFYVIRNRGHFGNVTVFWQLFANYTPLEQSQEFVNTSGYIIFTTGEKTKPIVLKAISDKIPEFNEFFELRLTNISGGYPGEGGKLATKDLNASVLIPFNDDPFGVFAIDKDNLDQEVAEDVLSVDDTSSVTSFTIVRQQGAFGDVRVSWEILSEAFPQGLPLMQDFILMATFPEAVKLQPHARRHHSGTDAFFFSGFPGSYGTISLQTQSEDIPRKLANFTFSAWLMPRPNTDGFIVSKGNGNGTMYYGVKVQTNESHVSVMLHYTTMGSNSTQVARATAMKFVEDNVWVHAIIAVEDGIIEFYLDGNPMPGGIKSLKGEAIMNDVAPVNVGSDPEGRQLFTGLLQDVRLYSVRLNQSEIRELNGQPAKTDFRNVAGYLEYWQGEKLKSFVVETRDDREEEGEEVFYLQLVAVHGGARLPMPRPAARIRIMKSDNANGLFGFTGACIPDISEEGSTVSCIVERTRGALQSVYVNYTVTQLDSPARAPNVSDFAKPSGSIFFLPGQRSEVLNLQILDDDLPEFEEYFQVKLVSAQSEDGKPGSTPTSGASIDPDNAINNVTIKASDHPYGLLQFQTAPITQAMIRPALEEARVTVQEEAGVVNLPVARAQGLLGRVLVAYRTTPITAIDSKDYENAEGLLDFLPGERLKYINMTIIDNSVPELDKVFRVELYNTQGGVDLFFGSGDSGSGESDTDFFLPPFHYHPANLGLASHIIVTISASDEAHGVFQFSNNSISVNGTEPEDGRSNVTLQVVRTFGALSNVTVYWQADADSEGELIYRSGSLTFTIGQTIGNIFLRISEDDIPELDKSFKIRLLNVSHGRLGSQTVSTLTVLASDDPYGLFLFSERSRPIRVAEADSLVVLTIQRRKGLMGRVQVTYRTLRDTDTVPYSTPGVGRASAGSDFIPVLESVTFSANQSEVNVTVRILDDNEPERAESVFVELSGVRLVEGAQTRPVALSPQLGLRNVSVAHVIIEASDDAFGVLQLSAPAVSVPEYYVGPIINVTRTGGIFADVSVKFRAVPMTARVGEDYSVASSDVVLLEGESSKPVPIIIINDVIPELEETFRIELLNQTTGGAFLGELTQSIITILPSDDPYGSFVFQAAPFTIEEPVVNAMEVSLPIVRNAGTIGYVSVYWHATINGRPATGDLQPLSGEVSFAPGETIKTLKVEVLADDVPEIEEIIKVELTGATNGGSIGAENVVNIIVPANDNPYGTVHFEQAAYRVSEPLEGVYIANITVRRSGGNFGLLEILYSTFEIDVVTNAQRNGHNFLIYYDRPLPGALSSAIRRPINITAARDPLNSCAAFCLQERACRAFSFTNASTATCFWVTTSTNQLSTAAQTLTYIKNTTAAASLFSSQATAGSDYINMIGQTATMLVGSSIANLTVPILTDSLPEMDESFMIQILKVSLVNMTVAEKHLPTIRQPDTTTVTIGMNGDAFGVFKLYSINPSASQNGLYLEVREETGTRVLLVIERTGGSLGRVTVEWMHVGGTAKPNADFNGTGATLIFAEGDVKKTIEFFITDDAEPEDNETMQIGLVRTEGGSRILPSSDTVTILILANDYAAGLVGFHPISQSVIVKEGERVPLLVQRTAPAIGNVTVEWRIEGPQTLLTFVESSGVLFFTERMLNDTIVLQLFDDGTPEDREEYRVILSNIQTKGVTATGVAALDPEGREAVISVAASDEPFGILRIAPSSINISTDEKDTKLRIYITREFGASGSVNISYETVKGSLQDLRLIEGALAEPGQDFQHVSSFVVMQDGQTSVSIPITIIDDDIPELKEFFLLNITSAVLITTLPTAPKLDTQGLVAEISINANDGVQGIISWQSTDYEVNETMGVLSLVAYRDAGTYGNVSVFFYAQNLEAQLGLDFNATASVLHFVNGERYKFVEVVIIDDPFPEGDEKFQLVLTNPSPGLELGKNITVTVTILANDDGHGIISFNNSEHFLLREPSSVSGLGQSVATLIILRNPPQGIFGTVAVQFSITDTNGTLNTEDLTPSEGFVVLEDGVRFKTLEIWAVLDADPEMNETFRVSLFNPTGGARLGQPRDTFITVLQNQAPLGLFRISPSSNRSISFPQVLWEILSDTDTTGDFLTLRGSATILAGERLAEIVLTLLPDAVPELEEVYTVRLSSVDGGAELDANRSSVRLRVRANDEPHGVFALFTEQQKLLVNGTDRSRYLALNISRLAGTFGNVSVEYQISYPTPGQSFTEDRSTGRTVVKDGEKSASITVPVSTQVFFVTGFNITVQLMNVSLIGPLLSSPPRVRLDAKIALVSVPEEAANAEVGFASLDLQVSDVRSGRCDAAINRLGLYGDVTVQWRAGFPPGQTPSGYQPGAITPSSGTVTLSHGQRNKLISFLAEYNMSVPVTHAVHLTTIESMSPGGARFRPGYTVAEVESLGLYQFHPDSLKLAITEDVHTVTIYVQRLYGFRTNRTQLYYRTWPGSALPGEDFTTVHDGQLLFEGRQRTAAINISILDDSLMEPNETFYVNLTDVRVISAGSTSPSAHPRIIAENSVSAITILASDTVIGFGLLSIGPAMSRTSEDRLEGAPPQQVILRVRRTAGETGVVSARVRVYDGSLVSPELYGAPFLQEHNGTWARERDDFTLESKTVTLVEGQTEAEVRLFILDDQEPEGQEVFYVYLSDPEGGAQIISSPDQSGITFFAKIIILGSDFHNGIVGFTLTSQSGQVLDEDSDNRTVVLFLQRQENRAFEDVFVSWRATFSLTVPALLSEGVNLTQELQHSSGSVLCRKGQVLCLLQLEVRPDQDPEFQVWFLVEIYEVGDGAAINQSARFANVTMLESDDPQGLVYFAIGSRLPVATLRANRVTLQVYREGSVASAISVKYRLQELPKAESIGPTLIWPAVADADFIMASGYLTFDIGQHSAGLDISLTPSVGSSNPTPKRFHVILSDATGDARVHPVYGTANVTLVSDNDTQAVWALLEQLHQPLDETLINRVLQGLINKVSTDMTHEQMSAVLDAAGKILSEAEQTPLKVSSRALTYDLLCSLAKPSRTDTRGLSYLATVAERFAFSLVSGTPCSTDDKRGKTLDTCPYFTITAYHWYPTDINAHTFTGTNSDTVTLPDALLEVPVLPGGGMSLLACQKLHFIEYHTEHWFLTNTKGSALNNKVFSVSLQGRGSRPLADGKEVVYRIHTPDRRAKPRQSLCLLWNQEAESWLSDGQFCRVVDDSQNFVECACSHLSIYTASAEIGSLSSYNEAFYTAGFICISGFALAIISHVLCSKFPMFAAKLLTHMMVACLGTQGDNPAISSLPSHKTRGKRGGGKWLVD